jgi:DNA phosphorothioation-dependent restriction protein DptG
MPEDKALYNTSLPWLDAEDKAEVFEAIDTALRKYFKEKFSRVA